MVVKTSKQTPSGQDFCSGTLLLGLEQTSAGGGGGTVPEARQARPQPQDQLQQEVQQSQPQQPLPVSEVTPGETRGAQPDLVIRARPEPDEALPAPVSSRVPGRTLPGTAPEANPVENPTEKSSTPQSSDRAGDSGEAGGRASDAQLLVDARAGGGGGSLVLHEGNGAAQGALILDGHGGVSGEPAKEAFVASEDTAQLGDASGNAAGEPQREPGLATAGGGGSRGGEELSAAQQSPGLVGSGHPVVGASKGQPGSEPAASAKTDAVPSAPADAAASGNSAVGVSSGSSSTALPSGGAAAGLAHGAGGRLEGEQGGVGKGDPQLPEGGLLEGSEQGSRQVSEQPLRPDELRAREARAVREEWAAGLREAAAAAAKAQRAGRSAGGYEQSATPTGSGNVINEEGGSSEKEKSGSGGGGHGPRLDPGAARSGADGGERGATPGTGGEPVGTIGGAGDGPRLAAGAAGAGVAVAREAVGAGDSTAVPAPVLDVQGDTGTQGGQTMGTPGGQQFEAQAGDAAARAQTPSPTLGGLNAHQREQAGANSAEWARLQAEAASGRDRKEETGGSRPEQSGAESENFNTPQAAGDGDGGTRALNNPGRGAAGAVAALAAAGARLRARLQRACYANPALTMLQVSALASRDLCASPCSVMRCTGASVNLSWHAAHLQARLLNKPCADHAALHRTFVVALGFAAAWA